MKYNIYIVAITLSLMMIPAFAAPTNLLQNGDFENVTEGKIAEWSGTPVALSSDAHTASKGTRSLKLFSDDAELLPIAVQNITKFQPDKKYRLEYQAQTAKSGQQFRVYIDVWQGKKWLQGIASNWRDGSDKWQDVITDFTPGQSADRLMVVIQLKGPGTLWVDNISLTESSKEQAAKSALPKNKPGDEPGDELVQNGGFEQLEKDHLQSWSSSPTGVSLSNKMVKSGENSLELSSQDKEANVIITQDIRDFKNNQKYRLSYQVRGGEINQEYRVYIGVWNDKQWVTGIDSQWRKSADTWQNIITDFTLTQPADRLQIVLQLKSPGTIYFDDVSLTKAPAEVLPPELAQFVGSSKYVQIMPDRTFRVQGKPFFPIKIWGWQSASAEAMAKAHDFGFNTISTTHMDEIGPQVMQLYLNMAQKYDLMILPAARVELPSAQAQQLLPGKLAGLRRVIEKIKDHPALFGYSIADEPALGKYDLPSIATAAQMIRELDPNHPIYINHAPRNTVEELARYNRYTDIAGSDIYPVWKTGIDRHSDLPNKTISVVGDETIKNLQAVDYKKPVMETLQAFAWSDPPASPGTKDEPFPTHQQLRFMGYDSIVSGATGVSYYQDGRYKEIRPELKPIIREFAALQDALAGGKLLNTEKVSASPDIKVLAQQWNGYTILIAVNRSNKEVPAKLDWTSLPATKNASLKVLFENRSIMPQAEVLSDTFAPYDVHVYTDAAQEDKVLRPFKPLRMVDPDQQKSADAAANAALITKFDAMVPREGRTNLARMEGVTVTCSTELGGMKAIHVNDGDRWGAQWNDATRYEYPDWVALNFPKTVTINQIAIFSADLQIQGISTSVGLRDYEVQTQQKGGAWETIRKVQGQEEALKVINLEKPVRADTLRIWITATAGTNDYSRIREIEVYGPDNKA